LAVALRLVELGFSPVPIKDKKPLVQWRIFQFRKVSEEEVREWWTRYPDASMAVLCGHQHDLVVVDTDSTEAEAWARANLPPTPRVVITRRGFHRHYRHPGMEVRSKSYEVAPGVWVDVKGDRAQCTAPGSVHPSGHVYETSTKWSNGDKLPLLPRVIVQLACVIPQMPEQAKQPDSFDEADGVTRMRQYFSKHPLPAVGSGSDRACFNAAVFCGAVGVSEEEFVSEVLRQHSDWDDRWVRSKWRAADRYGIKQ
jgi:hypothetical protein